MSALPWYMSAADEIVDRRGHDRVQAAVPLTILHGCGTEQRTRLGDANERGVGFAWSEPLAPGSPLRLELEVLVPTRIDVGPEIGALIIDGPEQSQFLRVTGTVRQCRRRARDHWIGVMLDDPTCPEEAETLREMELWLDHLRSVHEDWS